jgi:ribosome-binding protein aMBF1 (putative translation factor)
VLGLSPALLLLGSAQRGSDRLGVTTKFDAEHTLHLGEQRRIRQDKKDANGKSMSQKDLATKINEKPQVIAEYESGRAVPNTALLAKMERVLGVKLRGAF